MHQLIFFRCILKSFFKLSVCKPQTCIIEWRIAFFNFTTTGTAAKTTHTAGVATPARLPRAVPATAGAASARAGLLSCYFLAPTRSAPEPRVQKVSSYIRCSNNFRRYNYCCLTSWFVCFGRFYTILWLMVVSNQLIMVIS